MSQKASHLLYLPHTYRNMFFVALYHISYIKDPIWKPTFTLHSNLRFYRNQQQSKKKSKMNLNLHRKKIDILVVFKCVNFMVIHTFNYENRICIYPPGRYIKWHFREAYISNNKKTECWQSIEIHITSTHNMYRKYVNCRTYRYGNFVTLFGIILLWCFQCFFFQHIPKWRKGCYFANKRLEKK